MSNRLLIAAFIPNTTALGGLVGLQGLAMFHQQIHHELMMQFHEHNILLMINHQNQLHFLLMQ